MWLFKKWKDENNLSSWLGLWKMSGNVNFSERKIQNGWIGSFARNVHSWKVQPYITDNAKWYIGPRGPICYETEV